MTALEPASEPLRVLVLGGTGFIGPHFVQAAVDRGHTVSVFNRGRSEAELPDVVTRLVGDRDGNLEAIRDGTWDAAIDLATYGPRWVRSLGEALGDRIGHYTFISTIGVYADIEASSADDEDGNVREWDDSADPYSLSAPRGGYEYGALKVLSEREAERQFPGRTLVLRPGYIAGPGDPVGGLTYWPVRVKMGGEILAAGDPQLSVQFIDVRDLAEWAIRLMETRTAGTFNVAGPADPLNLGQLVRDAGAVSGLTWVPFGWLAAREDRELWNRLLFWSTEHGAFGGSVEIERALADGLTTRPLEDTFADVLAWYRRRPPADQVLRIIRRAEGSEGNAMQFVDTPWSVYLERERQALADWHGLTAGT